MKKYKNMTNQEKRDYGNSFLGIAEYTFGYWLNLMITIYALIFIVTTAGFILTLDLGIFLKSFHMFNPLEHTWVRIVMLSLFVPAWIVCRIFQNIINFYPVPKDKDENSIDLKPIPGWKEEHPTPEITVMRRTN